MTEPPQPAGSVPVALGAHTELRRAEAFELRFKGGSATAWVTGRRTPLPPFGLALLDAFGVPRPAAEGLDRAAGGGLGVGDWARLHGALAVLVGAGVLVRSDAALGDVQGARDPYDDPAVHLAMLRDGVRTGAFLTAIEGIVRPGDVVLEVGTGTGILAVAAAKAGARRVYAVEASGVAEVARGVFEANGVADRITLLRDRSTAVELPERADVLITETLGDDPLGEGIVDIVRDARRRLLVPLPRLIPRRLDLFAAPVELAAEDRRELLGTPEVWNDLGSRYGLDLGPLASGFGGRRRLLVAPQRARRWRRLADPVRLAAVNLATALPVVEASAELRIESPGRLDGVLLWGEVDLGGGVRLSQDPAAEAGPGHWRTAVWCDPEGMEVAAGERPRLRLRAAGAATSLAWGALDVGGAPGGETAAMTPSPTPAGLAPVDPTEAVAAGRVLVRDVGGEHCALLDLATGRTLELGGAGAVVAAALREGEGSLDALAARLCGEYEVESEVARRDCGALLSQLERWLAAG